MTTSIVAMAIVLGSLVAFGLIFGSFVNALVWRLHSQQAINDTLAEGTATSKQVRKLKAELASLSMAKGRSMCSNCHHPLAPKDLVPLFSWLWLRGKCRYCHQPIQDTPLLEAGLPVVFVVSYIAWPLELNGYGLLAFCFWLVFLTGFAALTAYDSRWFLLPDTIVWPLAVLAAVQVILHATLFGGGLPTIMAALWGVLVCSGIFYVLFTISQGEWIGGGDVKLGIILGLLAGGPLAGLLLIFIASLLGTFASLPLLLQKKLQRTSIIPFGPFLMLAAVIIVVSGPRLTNWLSSLLVV